MTPATWFILICVVLWAFMLAYNHYTSQPTERDIHHHPALRWLSSEECQLGVEGTATVLREMRRLEAEQRAAKLKYTRDVEDGISSGHRMAIFEQQVPYEGRRAPKATRSVPRRIELVLPRQGKP